MNRDKLLVAIDRDASLDYATGSFIHQALRAVVELPEEPWDLAEQDFPDHYAEFHNGWKEAMKVVLETVEKALEHFTES